MKWLRDLLARIEKVSAEQIAKQEPTPVEEGEKIVGIVPLDLRKVYAYNGALVDEVNERIEKHVELHRSDHHKNGDCKKFHEEVEALREEARILNTLFWKSLRSELGLQGKSIGVRAGWRVVILSKKDEDEPRIEVVGVGISGSLADLLRAAGR